MCHEFFLTGMLLVATLSSAEVPADPISLVCSGNFYIYRGDGPAQRATIDTLTIRIDESAQTMSIGGTLDTDATGPLAINNEQFSSTMAHPVEAMGVRYLYLMVTVSRFTGETLIASVQDPKTLGKGVAHFNGTCKRKARLF